MIYIVIVIVLLALTLIWHIIRSMIHRNYSKSYAVNSNKHGEKNAVKKQKKPKKWELKSDGHIEAEEAVYAEQMKTRYAYYREFQKNPPEIRHIGRTILASDNYEAADSVIAEFKNLSAASSHEPLGALAVINDFNYHNVWYLHGISDYVKSVIFDEAAGKTVYLSDHRVLVVNSGDIDGLRREYAIFENS